MKISSFHKFVAMFIISFSIAFFSFNAKAQSEQLTKQDVIEIIREYIEENPDDILQSIIDKSRDRLRQKQIASVDQYKDLIFDDKGSPVAGNLKGDVTIVEFVDYNCGFCKRAAEALEVVMKEDKNIKVIFKELPVLGDVSKNTAKWALAANKQGKYFEFHMALMKNRRPITTALLTSLAQSVGLDVSKLEKDAKGDEVEKQLTRDYELAVKMNLTGTPVFIIGDELHMGASTAPELRTKVKEYRERQKK